MSAKVFVSSTYVDLKAHRQRVIAQLRQAGFHVDPMEDWTSDADEPTQFCLDRLYDCHACVLLVGFRRGFVPPGQEHSITQMEYDRAIDRGIDVLPFLLDDQVVGWPEQHDDRAKDPQLKAWRDHLGLRHGVGRFTADPASVEVLPACSRWKDRQHEREQVRDYLASIRTAHGAIRFLGLPPLHDNQDMRIDRLFVEPQLSEQPIAPEEFPLGWPGRRPLGEVIATGNRLVILGDPGSGKSTLVDWLAWQLADERPNAWKARLGSRIPIPLILRDLDLTREVTWDRLLDAFLARPIGKHLSRAYCLRMLDEGHALVMLDGLDEVGDIRIRRDLRDAVQAGLQRFGRCACLLTSRVVGYADVPFHLLPDTEREEEIKGIIHVTPARFATLAYVAPFDDTQIDQFAQHWYAEREADPDKAHEGAKQLVQAVHRDHDTLRLARVPNLLTMMALIHRNRATLPNGKALLYEDIAQAYLKTIDEFRQISEYTDSLEDMKQWLGEVGFKMQQRRRAQDEDQALVIDGDILRGWLGTAMAGTGKPAAADDVRRFLDIIKRRSGLMIERGENQFAFTHLSFQEYFAAVYLAYWVLSTEWLLGEEVPPGTAAADLQRHAADYGWEETLVFLFELLAGETPRGKQEIRKAVFGSDWSAVTCRHGESPQTAILLARLTSDPHVNWDPNTQASAVDRCLTVAAEYHQTVDLASILETACRWREHVAGHEVEYHRRNDTIDLYEAAPGILRPLLSGEPAIVDQRLHQLVDRWTSADIPQLSLGLPPLSDLSPLARLTGLTTLVVEVTRKVDLSPLGTLAGLRNLQLYVQKMTDLLPLARLTGLTTLLVSPGVSDLSLFAGLTGLTALVLEDTQVSDLSPLARLTGLTMLALGRAQVFGLSPLVLDNAQVSDLSPLAGLTRLQYLDLGGHRVSDLSPLARLTGLTTLWLSGHRVSDLLPLAGLTNLQYLHLIGTSVSDLSPLAALTKLQYLDLTGTPVSDLSPLAGLTGLTMLSLGRTLVPEDEVAKLRAFLPGLEVHL